MIPLSIKTSTFAKSSDFFFLLQDLLLGLAATGLQLEYVALSLEPGSWRREAGSWKVEDWRPGRCQLEIGHGQTSVQLVVVAYI